MAFSWLKWTGFWGLMDILYGHRIWIHIGPCVTKKIKRNGQPSVTSRRAFVGRCCHNKMRQLYGKRQIKGIVTLQGTLLHTKTYRIYNTKCFGKWWTYSVVLQEIWAWALWPWSRVTILPATKPLHIRHKKSALDPHWTSNDLAISG